MRATLTFTAAVALCLGVVPLTTGNTANAQSAAQIIDKLSPTGGGGPVVTRGIRLGSPPPAGQSSTATTRPATEASTGGMARPPAAARPAEANLTVPFASGSAAISPAATHVLDQLGAALTSPKLADFKFRVEGHTDTVGSPETNKALSEQRAASVTDYLATKFNIDRARLTPVGMGEEGLLIATGPNVSNSANRRVLVVNLGH
jgi:outer membrane protein OmpA-like peptidoglycan-associated protein